MDNLSEIREKEKENKRQTRIIAFTLIAMISFLLLVLDIPAI